MNKVLFRIIIICGLLFAASGSDQATHPLCGSTFRTEAALLPAPALDYTLTAGAELVKDKPR